MVVLSHPSKVFGIEAQENSGCLLPSRRLRLAERRVGKGFEA